MLTDTMRTKIQDQIASLAQEMAEHSHDCNRWDALVWPDGDVQIIERASDNEWSVIDGDANRPIERLLRVGFGAVPCNCDSCSRGATGRERCADSDASVYEEQMLSALDEISDEYWEPTLADITESAERTAIAAALDRHNGNVTHSAGALGLTRNGLQKKLAALGIEAAQYR